jgi:hypothetical protein
MPMRNKLSVGHRTPGCCLTLRREAGSRPRNCGQHCSMLAMTPEAGGNTIVRAAEDQIFPVPVPDRVPKNRPTNQPLDPSTPRCLSNPVATVAHARMHAWLFSNAVCRATALPLWAGGMMFVVGLNLTTKPGQAGLKAGQPWRRVPDSIAVPRSRTLGAGTGSYSLTLLFCGACDCEYRAGSQRVNTAVDGPGWVGSSRAARNH